jgi:hypothetical protein
MRVIAPARRTTAELSQAADPILEKRASAAPELLGDVDCAASDGLSPALIEELGRILGEALVLQYQQDNETIVNTRPGPNYTAPDGRP